MKRINIDYLFNTSDDCNFCAHDLKVEEEEMQTDIRSIGTLRRRTFYIPFTGEFVCSYYILKILGESGYFILPSKSGENLKLKLAEYEEDQATKGIKL